MGLSRVSDLLLTGNGLLRFFSMLGRVRLGSGLSSCRWVTEREDSGLSSRSPVRGLGRVGIRIGRQRLNCPRSSLNHASRAPRPNPKSAEIPRLRSRIMCLFAPTTSLVGWLARDRRVGELESARVHSFGPLCENDERKIIY